MNDQKFKEEIKADSCTIIDRGSWTHPLLPQRTAPQSLQTGPDAPAMSFTLRNHSAEDVILTDGPSSQSLDGRFKHRARLVKHAISSK